MKNNWLTLKSLFLCVSALGVSGLILSGCTENANLNVGEWSLEYDAHANGIDISKGSKLIYDNVYAAYKLADSVVSTRDYAKHHVSTKKINDYFGEGYHYEVTYTGNNLPALVQSADVAHGPGGGAGQSPRHPGVGPHLPPRGGQPPGSDPVRLLHPAGRGVCD